MKKIVLAGITIHFLFACTKNEEFQPTESPNPTVSLKLKQNQAKAYATLFSSHLEKMEIN